MKRIARRVLATIMALALMTSIPMQAKAAEIQPTTVPLVQDGYYKEIERDGVFNRHDDEGNLISSIKVEDALFKVNATLTEGWGKVTISESNVEGTFKDATLDQKGYFRCSFTTNSGTVYDDVVVKVATMEWAKWDTANRAKAAAVAAAAAAANRVGNSGNGNSGNGNSGNGNSGNGNSGNGNSGNGNSGNGNSGNGNDGGNSGGDPNPGYQGWPGSSAPAGDPNPGYTGW